MCLQGTRREIDVRSWLLFQFTRELCKWQIWNIHVRADIIAVSFYYVAQKFQFQLTSWIKWLFQNYWQMMFHVFCFCWISWSFEWYSCFITWVFITPMIYQNFFFLLPKLVLARHTSDPLLRTRCRFIHRNLNSIQTSVRCLPRMWNVSSVFVHFFHALFLHFSCFNFYDIFTTTFSLFFQLQFCLLPIFILFISCLLSVYTFF